MIDYLICLAWVVGGVAALVVAVLGCVLVDKLYSKYISHRITPVAKNAIVGVFYVGLLLLMLFSVFIALPLAVCDSSGRC